MDSQKSDEFYHKLREQLQETGKWPSDYLYKFIVPTDGDKIERINSIFNNTGAVIELKQSKKGKYTSISITVNREDPDAVIAKYMEVSVVEGVISL